MRANQDFTQSSGVNNGNKDTSFYNTIHLTGKELAKAKKQAESQERKIFDLLKSYPLENFTKSEIKLKLVLEGKISEKTPESSISRALSDLKDEGKVLKLAKFREGFLGKPNHVWQAKPELTLSSTGTQTTLF